MQKWSDSAGDYYFEHLNSQLEVSKQGIINILLLHPEQLMSAKADGASLTS